MYNVSELNTLQYAPDLCIGCEMCVYVCPHAVFTMNGRAALMTNPDNCMECGACQQNCPVNAIMVDSGVGCAQAVINGFLRGTEPDCDCSGGCCG